MIVNLIKILSKSLMRLLKYVLSSLLVGCIVLILLLFTGPGNKLIVKLIDHSVPELVLTMEQRSLLRGGVFSVKYKNEYITLDIKDVSLHLNFMSCASLCIDTISAQSVDIYMPEFTENNDQENEQSSDIGKIITPLSIAINSLSVASVSFRYDDLEVSAKEITAKANWQQNTVAVDFFEVASLSLLLPTSQSIKQDNSSEDMSLPVITPIESSTPLNWQVARLKVDEFDILQGTEQYKINYVNVAANQENSLINISQLNAQYADYKSDSSAKFDFSKANPLSLNVSIVDNANTLMLKAKGDLDKLIIDASLSGPNSAELSAQISLTQPSMPFQLGLKAPQVSLEQLGQPISLAESQFNLSGNLKEYNYRVMSKITYDDLPAVNITGQGLGNQFQTTVQELVAETEKSKVSVSGNISWQENLNANLSISSDKLAIEELKPEISSNLKLNAKTSFKASEQGWQLVLPLCELTGNINNVPLEFSSAFDLDDQFHFNIKKFDLHNGTNHIALVGKLTDLWSLDGTLSISDSSSLDAELKGTGDVKFSVKGKALTPAFDWSVKLENLVYKDIELSQLDSQGYIDMAQDFLGNAVINASDFTYQGQLIQQIEIGANGNLSNHQASLKLKSNYANLQSKLTAGLNSNEYRVAVEALSLIRGEFNLANDHVINASYDIPTKSVTVSSHCWKGRYSELCFADTSISSKDGDVAASLKELDLSGLSVFLPNTILPSGLVTGYFNAKWQDNKIKAVSGELKSDSINFDVDESFVKTHLPIDTLHIALNGEQDNLKLDATIKSTVLGDLTSNIQIKNINSSRDILGDIQLKSLNFSNLKGFAQKIDNLGGELNASLSLSGQAYDPRLNGSLTLEKIVFIAPWLPVDISDGKFNMIFDDNKARVSANINDLEEGKLTLAGDINWQHDLKLDMAVKGDAYRLVLSPTSWLAMTPDINISLNNRIIKLSGQVDIVDGLIKVNQLPKGAVTVSSDEVIINTHSAKDKELPIKYGIDLAVVIANKVNIDSFGLKSRLEGDLLFRQQSNRPLIATGTLNLPDGKYRVFGQELLIKNGELNFNGAVDKPYLNVKAVRNPDLTSDGVIVGVTLTGVIDTPTLKVFSQPSMDEMMALHYLLTGRSINDSNSTSETMLTQFLLDQSLARGGGNVSQIVEAFGFQDVSLSSRGSGDDTKVEISGYVAPDIQVSYRIGIFNSLSEVAVRYYLLPQLYIEAISGLNNSLDMLYKFEFE